MMPAASAARQHTTTTAKQLTPAAARPHPILNSSAHNDMQTEIGATQNQFNINIARGPGRWLGWVRERR